MLAVCATGIPWRTLNRITQRTAPFYFISGGISRRHRQEQQKEETFLNPVEILATHSYEKEFL